MTAAETRSQAPAAPTPAGGGTETSAWSPLRSALFRGLWIANLVSFVGTWMHEVGAAWLMTTLAPSPLMVAAVQAAASLPMFALVLPAGALADVIDRRRLLLVAQGWMLGVAALLAGLTWRGTVSPGALLTLTALLAAGAALAAPSFQALLPEAVSAGELPRAVALTSLAVNVARAVGPAVGGLLVAAAGPAAAFTLNALSFAGVLWVVGRWRREASRRTLPAERFLGALRAGVRYVRHAPRLLAVLVRVGSFTFAGSALWALLPLFARTELGIGAAGYGGLLAVFGAGAVSGAAILPRLRQRIDLDLLVSLAALLFAGALGGLAWTPGLPWALAAMAIGGVAWLLLLSSFFVAAQTVLPAWVRGRGLATYLLVFFGSLALGSLAWGAVASAIGLRRGLVVAGIAAALGVALRWRFRLRGGEDLDLSPSRAWPCPRVAGAIEPDQGPVMITVEYRIDPAEEPEFRRAMERVRRARQRDGAFFWDLFRDAADPGRYVEVYLADSWLEHLRQHERLTEQDRLSEATAWRLVEDGHPKEVQHLISVGTRE